MADRYDIMYDFQYRSAKKLENSSYLEDLTGLLEAVASKVDNELIYCFSNEYYMENHKDEPNSSFEIFIRNFKNSIFYGSCEKIYIIRGSAGIGKSLFFKKGAQLLIKSTNDSQKYINMGVDFKNIDNDNTVRYYENWIYEELYQNAIDNIRLLGASENELFEEAFKQFGNTHKTKHVALFPLKFFCERIYERYGKPCIIFFDNIDLASVETQEKVFDAIVRVCEKFNEFMRAYQAPDCYRIYFAMRPETELRYKEGRIGEAINFPLPNILKITLGIINKALLEVAEDFDKKGEISCHITCKDVISSQDKMMTFETYTEVARYFYRVLEYYLRDIWNSNPQIIERLGTSEEFHCNVVNYNVRTFVRFFADTIKNGGFKPFTKEFNQKYGVKHYSVYDYIEMVIRGRWPMHPGNKHINGEGSNKAPIVYNIFDTSLYGNNQKDKVKHFMLNIRILQYFFLCSENLEISYGEMEDALSNFFERDYIKYATKKLVYVRFLYSYVQGDDIIATIKDWKNIQMDNSIKLKISPVGKFYLEKMICEFEYLYQMALSSLMCTEYVEELRPCWKIEKEKTVLFFLQSMFDIIKDNIDDYNAGKIITFKKLFYYIDDQLGSRPYRRMLERFISVMRNKVQRAEKLDTNNLNNLVDILNKAIRLKDDVTNYFNCIF